MSDEIRVLIDRSIDVAQKALANVRLSEEEFQGDEEKWHATAYMFTRVHSILDYLLTKRVGYHERAHGRELRQIRNKLGHITEPPRPDHMQNSDRNTCRRCWNN